MGQPFCEFVNDDVMTYECLKCGTCLSGKKHIVSTEFRGTLGPGILFDRVVNVILSDSSQRQMTTGLHYVRDTFCKVCKTKIGWFYEFATEESQRYKEGKYVLEEKLLKTRPGIPDTRGGNPHCNL